MVSNSIANYKNNRVTPNHQQSTDQKTFYLDTQGRQSLNFDQAGHQSRLDDNALIYIMPFFGLSIAEEEEGPSLKRKYSFFENFNSFDINRFKFYQI